MRKRKKYDDEQVRPKKNYHFSCKPKSSLKNILMNLQLSPQKLSEKRHTHKAISTIVQNGNVLSPYKGNKAAATK